jgi:hypothetical protein
MRLNVAATPQQRAAILTAAGCAVVFTNAPDLSATYALDDTTLAQIGSVARDAAAGLGLPFFERTDPNARFNYPDITRTPHVFTSEQVQSLYIALRDYTAGLAYYATGQIPEPPAQPVTIAD